MGSPFTGASPYADRVGIIKTGDKAAMSSTIKVIGDGAGNDSHLYLGINKVGFGEAVAMTKSSTEINNTVVKAAYISVTQNVDLDAIETNSNASKVKTDYLTVTGAVDLDAFGVKLGYISVSQAVNLDTMESDISSAKGKTDFLTVTGSVNLDTMSTKVGYISVTQAVDLDAIEARVNELDASVILKGTWDASAGTLPGGGVAQAGWSYIVSVGGTVDGIVFVANDRIIAITDNASTSTYAANWHKADYTDAVLSVDGLTGAVNLSGIYQGLNSNLTTLAGLTATTNNMIVSVAGAWASRTPTQVKTTLSLDAVENTALSTWAGTNQITTVGTVTTGTWNADAISYTKGGSGLTGFTALSIAVTNTVNTRTQIAPSAGQSIRINAGGTAWEAYTPGSGGGSSVFSDLTAATATNTINHAAYANEWQWNSLATGNGLKFSSTSTAYSNTLYTDISDALVGVINVGENSASNVVSKSLYVANRNKGTGAVNYGIYTTVETTGVTSPTAGITSMALVAVGHQGGGLQFGGASSTAGVIWSWAVTPTTTNYTLSATATDTNINAVNNNSLRIGGSSRLYVTTVGVTIGNGNTPVGKLNIMDTVVATGNYGMVIIGANAVYSGSAGHFGRPGAEAAAYSSNTAGTYLAMNAPSGFTGDLFNMQTAGVSYLRLSGAGTLSVNVNDKTAVSASAQFQIDSTTKGFLPPRMTGTQAEAISGPATGLLVFSTDGSGATITSAGWWGYTGSAWVKLN